MLTLSQSRRTEGRSGPRAFAMVAVVCMVLLALVAVVQVAHTHQGVSDADHCPLCIVMHAAVPVVVAAALIALVQLATTPPVFEVTRPARHYWHAQLFTRPPPMAR